MKSATIRDVAKAADVSVATVSRVLNGNDVVSGQTRERVLAAAAALDYVPHSGARSLSRRRTDTIGVLLPDLHGEFFSELIRGIDQATRVEGLHLLLSHSHGDAAEAVAAIRTMRSRIDAMIVMSPDADNAALCKAMNGVAPLVLLGNGDGSDGHPVLAIDNVAGAAGMTAHLLACGHRDIAFIAGPAGNLDADQRLEGFRSALDSRGLTAKAVLQGDFTEAAGVSAARELVHQGLPDAIFAANDMMAIGALQALREFGVPAPENVAIAGFDDIPVARFLDPPLSTVAVPIAEIGRQAVESCLDLLAGRPAASIMFQPTVVPRESTRPRELHHTDSKSDRGEKRYGQVSIS